MPILVLADDLSGAAEIASLGVRYGLNARVARSIPDPTPADLHVIDIDTRQCSDADAVDRTRQTLAGVDVALYDWCYLKIDSVLRGPVIAPLQEMLRTLGRRRAVLAPQNPTRQRTIVKGDYLIAGVPIHKTPFADDPDFVSLRSDVRDLLGGTETDSVTSLREGKEWPVSGIIVPDAAQFQTLDRLAHRVDETTLAAGSSDFFESMLNRHGHDRLAAQSQSPIPASGLIVCGSAATTSLQAVAEARRDGAPIYDMPLRLYETEESDPDSLNAWTKNIVRAMKQHPRVVVTIGHALKPDRRAGTRLTSLLAEVIVRVCSIQEIGALFVEGGATGAAIASRFVWQTFAAEYDATGQVYRLRPASFEAPLFALKPGSYPWPSTIFSPHSRSAPASMSGSHS